MTTRWPTLRLTLDVPGRVRAATRVPIVLRAENTGSAPLDLYLRGRTIAFDVTIDRSSGERVWRRLEGEIVPAIVQLRTLAPGEIMALEASWDQRDANGGAVSPGDYVVRASLLTDMPESLDSDRVPLRVVPN